MQPVTRRVKVLRVLPAWRSPLPPQSLMFRACCCPVQVRGYQLALDAEYPLVLLNTATTNDCACWSTFTYLDSAPTVLAGGVCVGASCVLSICVLRHTHVMCWFARVMPVTGHGEGGSTHSVTVLACGVCVGTWCMRVACLAACACGVLTCTSLVEDVKRTLCSCRCTHDVHNLVWLAPLCTFLGWSRPQTVLLALRYVLSHAHVAVGFVVTVCTLQISLAPKLVGLRPTPSLKVDARNVAGPNQLQILKAHD